MVYRKVEFGQFKTCLITLVENGMELVQEEEIRTHGSPCHVKTFTDVSDGARVAMITELENYYLLENSNVNS